MKLIWLELAIVFLICFGILISGILPDIFTMNDDFRNTNIIFDTADLGICTPEDMLRTKSSSDSDLISDNYYIINLTEI